jgi:hypothetical protein
MVMDINLVPNAYRAEYLHADGVWHLDVRGIESLKSALKSEREFRKHVKKLAADDAHVRKLIAQAEIAAGIAKRK